jgi:radical SAM superfamily enzyme YgiQ (UPF0313 family)
VKILLADIEGARGYISKDTVAGGYGSRLTPISRVTATFEFFKKRFHGNWLSVQMAYAAAILAEQGHDVRFTSRDFEPCDVALVLSSLVDYRNEVQWASRARKAGARVGFLGLAASKLPHLFENDADFVIQGEPEAAIQSLGNGKKLSGLVVSPAAPDLDTIPFPRWDLLAEKNSKPFRSLPLFSHRSRAITVLASRSCPEHCTYCPHRILAEHRERSVSNIIGELEYLCAEYKNPEIVFRDPLFTWSRDRCVELCNEIVNRKLKLQFECETRLDSLDEPLLDLLKKAGLRRIIFGVESVSPDTLRRVGRRPIPDAHQRHIIEACRKRKIETCGFYVFGFLDDTWDSIAATISHSIQLGSTFAQFKLLTPFPGTPLYKRMEPLIFERDWENYDGLTPTFNHPNLTTQELRFLLTSAYDLFYLRPSFTTNFLGIQDTRFRDLAGRLDTSASRKIREKKATAMARPLPW